MQCRDKFLLQSVAAGPGTTIKDITSEMVIRKKKLNSLHDCKNSKIVALLLSFGFEIGYCKKSKIVNFSMLLPSDYECHNLYKWESIIAVQ